MNTNLIISSRPSTFASNLNTLVSRALSLTLIGAAGVLTFAQYIAVA